MPRASKEQINLMLRQGKSNDRILMNTSLIVVAFTAFALIVTLQSQIFVAHNILAMQLVLAIPLLLTSTMANSKLAYTKHETHWETLAWATFIFGYGFLLNVLGILIALLIGLFPASLFFLVTIILTFLYSAVEISYNRNALSRRLTRDLIFILVLFIFGILPILAL